MAASECNIMMTKRIDLTGKCQTYRQTTAQIFFLQVFLSISIGIGTSAGTLTSLVIIKPQGRMKYR